MTQQKQNKQSGRLPVSSGHVVSYSKRGRPSRSGSVRIEPIRVRERNLARLAQVLEQYARYLDTNASKA